MALPVPSAKAISLIPTIFPCEIQWKVHGMVGGLKKKKKKKPSKDILIAILPQSAGANMCT